MIGAGKRIVTIHATKVGCDSHGYRQMWEVFLPRISDTGLTSLILWEMRGGVTGDDVLPPLVNSPISSLTNLDLSTNASWWENGEALAHLLEFLPRQTHLQDFWFRENNLTPDQTTQLLQCIARSHKDLNDLNLSESCNFD